MSFKPDFSDSYLSEEVTRPVPMPEGGCFRNFTMQRRYWLSYDVINIHRPMWPEELVKRARQWTQRYDISIDRAFPGVVWSMHHWWQIKQGYNTGLEVPPYPYGGFSPNDKNH